MNYDSSLCLYYDNYRELPSSLRLNGIYEIKRLNPKKSSGHDTIGGKVIQLCPNIFVYNLTKIFNNSIEIGEYPNDLKIAKVIALFKKGERHVPNNYRPISLLSCCNKLFKKILCKQLVKFLEDNNIISINLGLGNCIQLLKH